MRICAKEFVCIILGLLAAGLGPLVGGSLFYLFRGELTGENAAQMLAMSLLFYPFALVFACLIGLPLFLVARRFQLVRWWSAIGSGLFGGCLVAFLLAPSAPFYPNNYLLGATEGVASALLFFAVWRQGTAAFATI